MWDLTMFFMVVELTMLTENQCCRFGAKALMMAGGFPEKGSHSSERADYQPARHLQGFFFDAGKAAHRRYRPLPAATLHAGEIQALTYRLSTWSSTEGKRVPVATLLGRSREGKSRFCLFKG